MHRFQTISSKALLLLLLLICSHSLAQEQWQIDQAAGKYWYVGRTDVYSYDPKENNPGTIKVIPWENGEVKIEIHANIILDTSENVQVRYAFNQDLLDADPDYEAWDAKGIGFLGVTYVVASQAFVDQYLRYATTDGFVDVELANNQEGHPEYRRFMFEGFLDAYNELASELDVDRLKPTVSEINTVTTSTPNSLATPTSNSLSVYLPLILLVLGIVWVFSRTGRGSKRRGEGKSDQAVVIDRLRPVSALSPPEAVWPPPRTAPLPLGEVYLLKAGPFYKIGKSKNAEKRIKQIKLQLPYPVEVIHIVRTPEYSNLERYWHVRFKSKRANGEWFILTDEDVQAFIVYADNGY